MSLAFAEPALEEEFRGKFSREAHARHAVVFLLSAAATAALAAIDAIVVKHERLHVIWLIRYAVLVPSSLALALFGRVSPGTYLRWGERVTMASYVGGGVGIGGIGVSLAPLPVATAHYGIMCAALFILVMSSLGMVRFGRSFVVPSRCAIRSRPSMRGWPCASGCTPVRSSRGSSGPASTATTSGATRSTRPVGWNRTARRRGSR
jgi:hypothetical protein